MTIEIAELSLSALLKLHWDIFWALFLKIWWLPVGLITIGIGVALYNHFIINYWRD